MSGRTIMINKSPGDLVAPIPSEYVALVTRLIDQDNPNAPEEYDAHSIERLSYYLYHNDYDERALRTLPNLYFLYDLLKFTAQD
jgi:hypothetical protein